jgi:DNA invertase Pin-like site-specific DNA recombinase
MVQKSQRYIWTLQGFLYLCIVKLIKENKMKAVVFSRVSSVTERQNTERQVYDLMEYAKVNNIEVVQVFEEKISGAKKNAERAVLQNCIDFVKSEKIDIILVSEFSRLSRSVWELLELIKMFRDMQINVFFQKENLKIFEDGKENPLLPIYVSALGMVAQVERENIQFRLNSGRKLAIDKGVKFGRKVGSIKSTETKQEEYKEVIKLLKKGLSVANVVAICKDKGVKVSVSTAKRLKKEFVS